MTVPTLPNELRDLIYDHLSAIRLQAAWRGYRSRKIKVAYYKYYPHSFAVWGQPRYKCDYDNYPSQLDQAVESLRDIVIWCTTGWRSAAWWHEFEGDYDGGNYYTFKDALNESIIKWLWRYDRAHLYDLLESWRLNNSTGAEGLIFKEKIDAHFAGIRYVKPRSLKYRYNNFSVPERYVSPFPKTRRFPYN